MVLVLLVVKKELFTPTILETISVEEVVPSAVEVEVVQMHRMVVVLALVVLEAVALLLLGIQIYRNYGTFCTNR
jgi:hypothetical protein